MKGSEMKKLIVLVVLLLCLFGCRPAQADITLMTGENYSGVDLGRRITNSFELGSTVAVDYFADQSQPLKNFHITTGDTYVGVFGKLHLGPDDSKIDPYIGIRALSQDMNLRGAGAYEIYEAGVNIFLKGRLGIGFVYQRCERLIDKDRFLLAVPFMW